MAHTACIVYLLDCSSTVVAYYNNSCVTKCMQQRCGDVGCCAGSRRNYQRRAVWVLGRFDGNGLLTAISTLHANTNMAWTCLISDWRDHNLARIMSRNCRRARASSIKSRKMSVAALSLSRHQQNTHHHPRLFKNSRSREGATLNRSVSDSYPNS
jgi:hypothetical protein